MITPSLPAVCGLKYGVSGGSLYPSTSGSFLVSAEALRAVVQIELYDWRRHCGPIQHHHVSVGERSGGKHIAPKRHQGGLLARGAVKQRRRDPVQKVHVPDYEESTCGTL